MLKTKRQRAVVLALIAFFCTAAVTYVAVDWKRFGGGFLALFKGKGEQRLASSGGGVSSVSSGVDGATRHPDSSPLPRVAAAIAHSRHTAGAGGGAGNGKSDDDLFVYGNPAAGIPPGSFIVAQNDTPSGGNSGSGQSSGQAGAPESGGEGGAEGGGVGAPAPPPGNGSSGDGGVIGIVPGKTSTSTSPPPAPPPPPTSAPTVSTPATPPAPTTTPTQSGSNSPPPVEDPGTPPPPLAPVSAVPEASSLAMLSLGALFLAVAAQRKRKNA